MRLATLIVSTLLAATPGKPTRLTPAEKEARAFLDGVTGLSQPVARVAAEAAWRAAHRRHPDQHRGPRRGRESRRRPHRRPAGDREGPGAAGPGDASCSPLTVRQLRRLLLNAAENPGTIPDVVARRVEAEARQSSILEGFAFCLPARRAGPSARCACARPAPTRSTSSCARRPTSTSERRVWSASKEVGPAAASRASRLWCRCATRWPARWATPRSSPCRWPTTA